MRRLALALALGFCRPALADDAPMSAIDWLSNSIQQPVTVGLPQGGEPATAASVDTGKVEVTPLGQQATADGVGLLPARSTGLPRDLWGPASSADLAMAIRAERPDLFPSLNDLLTRLLLAETDPPFDSDKRALLFLARVDKLLDRGALDEAAALLDRAGIAASGEIFRRAFDVGLLSGTENGSCLALKAAPWLDPTYPTRVFCLARNGDWQGAALTLGTARALGFITAEEDEMMSRFLDPGLFEGEPPPAPPAHVTPLTFRLYEAIGEPLPTQGLPLAFAASDLRSTAGWKAQLEAAERLARSGSLADTRLFALYTASQPAASGGIWMRVSAMQKLDAALSGGDPAVIGPALEQAYSVMDEADLLPQLGRILADRLAGVALAGRPAALAFRLEMLAPGYETAAARHEPADATEAFLRDVARGIAPQPLAGNPESGAISAGFAERQLPDRARALIDDRRIGEAILLAIDLVSHGGNGDVAALTDGLRLLRYLGLESTARRAALEIVVLERRG